MKKYSLKLIIAQNKTQEQIFIKEERKRNLARIFNIKDPIELENKYEYFLTVRSNLRRKWIKENPDKTIQEDTISDQTVYDNLLRKKIEPKHKTHPIIAEELKRLEKLYPTKRNVNFIRKFTEFKYRIRNLPTTQRLQILPIENPTDFDILILFEQTLKDRVTISELVRKKEQIKKDIIETSKEIQTEKRKTFKEKLEEIYGPLTEKEFFDAKNNFRQRKFRLIHHPHNPRPDITDDEVIQDLKDSIEKRKSKQLSYQTEESKSESKIKDIAEENNIIANLISNIKFAHILDLNGYYEEADNLFSYTNIKNIYKTN